MNKKVLIISAALISLVFIAAGTAPALEIVPDSYTFTPSAGYQHEGTWTYDDPGLSKLTDGIYGEDNWTVNQGAEWVGWQGIAWDGSYVDGKITKENYDFRSIELNFDFGEVVTLSSLVLGINQDALFTWNVVFPSYISAETISSTLETPYDSANSGPNPLGNVYNNGRRHDVIFNFDPITTSTFSITLNNADNFDKLLWENFNDGMFWIFVDEVDFYDKHVNPVPEPATMLLFGTGLAGLAGVIRRKTKNLLK
ncbi:MAG: PEP-CTERM sorting domain-containing protein [Proteobacteria bacterium]|nr:PEP-CTERM sorting domain-containing protein [Pseudomonadota bacterium]MBU1708952.1 PEP-CTERM sorting domain-containing protein [Pseudomonadota bacterium]